MVEEILPNIFRITVPLPEHPLRTTNSYVIVSKERNLIIDTGWNRLECAEALLDGLEAIGANLLRTDLFLTHIHADHAGLMGLFKNKRAKIFCGRADLEVMDNYINTSPPKDWPALRRLAAPHGFSPEEIAAAIDVHPGNRYAPDCFENLIPVDDQDIIVVGNYKLQCVATPGHTPGHMCLYAPENKLVFSGDHLLGQLSPTLSQWNLQSTLLASYLTSLEKIAEYDVDIVLPGHWDIFSNYRLRIKETKAYHPLRNAEILEFLGDGEARSAYQIAAGISWNNKLHEWVFFPITRKWGAVADTLSHLCYLRDQGMLKMNSNQQQVTWHV
jgi:glyoxylase-like metal-dependent hydrolase (beta-lactamase superfamily II)